MILRCLLLLALVGCAPRPPQADDALRFAGTPRVNSPDDYVAFLKRTKFTKGELDNLPDRAIIVYGNLPALLDSAGLSGANISAVRIGTADPTVLQVVRPRDRPAFLAVQGLPGGGGVSNQVCELAALGAKRIVQVGTCAALGTFAPAGRVIVSTGAFKDSAGLMLSDPADAPRLVEPVAGADPADIARLLKLLEPTDVSGVGYTIPIFYHQPTGLLRELLASNRSPKANYLEMEHGALFAAAARSGVRAAALAVASDRYTLVDGRLDHTFEDHDSVVAGQRRAFAAALAFLDK